MLFKRYLYLQGVMMRVSNYLRKTILEAINKSFGACEVVLFGSRVDDTKRGGDFDIAIKSSISKAAFREAKVKFFKQLLLNDLNLPIDLVAYNSANEILKKEIDTKGVKL